MATVMPQKELHRKAVQWILEERADKPHKSLQALVDEAGMRFNLGPQDCEYLYDFLKENMSEV